MEPFEIGDFGRPVSRRVTALVLSAIALILPLICASSIAAGSNRDWRVLLVWAIGAAPALVLAAVVAARPRRPRVIAGMAIIEVMLIGAAYIVALVALSIAGSGE